MKKYRCLLSILLVLSIFLLAGCGSDSSIQTIQNALDPTTATDKTVTVTINLEGDSSIITGRYTGALKDGNPNGIGSFIAENDEGSLSYKGAFVNGKITGEGVLRFTMEGYELRYEGTFLNGALNGYGVTTAKTDDQTMTRAGTYTRGVFTPTVGETFNYIGQMDLYGVFELSDSIISYIDEHSEFFPVAEKYKVEEAPLRDFEYRQFTKTRSQEDIGLIKLKLYAVQVYEDKIEDTGDTVTSILAADDDSNLYALYYLSSVEVYDGDSFTAYVLPVATSSYSNVSGGTTIVIDLLGSYIEAG